ncbi:lysine--tRNA ligase [Planctomycetales bacterium ZRK34]|nr:lysine--tRNA ligase [Planctomycetales bacterium ZRK34]
MNDLFETRVEKFNILKNEGSHFPYSSERTHTVQAFLEDHDALVVSEQQVSLIGRVRFRNKMGKLMFLRADDETGRIQWMVSRQRVGDECFKSMQSNIDLGDLCRVSGRAFTTKRGEKSIDVDELQVLAKCVRPLPEKFHGLRDKELRYRQRELDLIMNRDSFEVFRQRSRIVAFIRQWLNGRGFTEVEVPALQMVYGGADADPFVTHVNAIDCNAFLSISPELFLKRLIVAGFPKVYSLSKNFRNEGIDATHNPEFTLMESYEAYSDYNDVMQMTEQLLEAICLELHGTTEIEYGEHTLSFKAPFRRVTFYDLLEETTGLKPDAPLKDIFAALKEHSGGQPIDVTGDRIGLLDKLLETAATDRIIQPTFLIDYPRETSPLCRPKRGNLDLIERFELFIAGMELANAYSELNDPVMQRKLLETQAAERENAGENPIVDEEFIRAVEYGMPPTGGLGLGIDRVIMLMTNQSSIRDVILYPFMRPQHGRATVESPSPMVTKKVNATPDRPDTRRLYLEDMYERTFTSRIVSLKRNLVVLEATAFYPHSGGQAGDTGVIAGIRVIDTVPDPSNKSIIVHVLEDEAPFEVGQEVECAIEWDSRYRTMRLHSASHIVEYELLRIVDLQRITTLVNGIADISRYRPDEIDESQAVDLQKTLNTRVNDFISKLQEISLTTDDNGYRTWKCGPIVEGCGGTHVLNTREIGSVDICVSLTGDELVVETKLNQP